MAYPPARVDGEVNQRMFCEPHTMAGGTFMGMLTGKAGAMVRTGLHDRRPPGQEQWDVLQFLHAGVAIATKILPDRSLR